MDSDISFTVSWSIGLGEAAIRSNSKRVKINSIISLRLAETFWAVSPIISNCCETSNEEGFRRALRQRALLMSWQKGSVWRLEVKFNDTITIIARSQTPAWIKILGSVSYTHFALKFSFRYHGNRGRSEQS